MPTKTVTESSHADFCRSFPVCENTKIEKPHREKTFDSDQNALSCFSLFNRNSINVTSKVANWQLMGENRILILLLCKLSEFWKSEFESGNEST